MRSCQASPAQRRVKLTALPTCSGNSSPSSPPSGGTPAATQSMQTWAKLEKLRPSQIQVTMRPRVRPTTPCTFRSEEHTSAPVTNAHLVCRLLLEKKKQL